jgi:hypothetical protein
MRQIEVSRTPGFRRPRWARGVLESLVADIIGIGRPEQAHPLSAHGPLGATTKQSCGTRIFSPGNDVKIDFRYKYSRAKQYQMRRALRIASVINKPKGHGTLARFEHIPGDDYSRPQRQRATAYDRTGRPGLCRRLCAL